MADVPPLGIALKAAFAASISATRRMKTRILALSLILALAAIPWGLQAGVGRLLLWQTVQVCVLAHHLLHVAAPCLSVETPAGVESGFVILRSPLDKSHVILSPTVAIIGIEAERLRRLGSPNYVADAWLNRHFAFPTGRQLLAADVGVAINSQRGRTQDQLHIHIDCLRPDVKARLAAAALRPGQWSQITLDDGELPYAATVLQGGLQHSNVVDLAAIHLNMSTKDMPLLTLAVVGLRSDPANLSFVLLAKRDPSNQHAELLLDHDCDEYRRQVGK